jgi:hypothetical protein
LEEKIDQPLEQDDYTTQYQQQTALWTQSKAFNPSYREQKYLRDKQEWSKKVNTYLENHLFVCPIPFNPQGKSMLNHTQRMMQETE